MAVHPGTLGIALLTLAACNAPDETLYMTTAPDGGPPWLMWGTSEEIVLTTESAAVLGGVVSQQLANVDFHYPTNWTILVAASVLFDPVPDPIGAQVNFNIRFGVGRSLLELPPVPIQWGNAELQPDGIGDLKVITEFPLAALTPAGPANMLRKFPAQSIQISADLRSLVAMGPGQTIRANVTTFAAPITHVRPEWFLGHIGQELGGR